MEYVTVTIIATISGALMGWTSASNIDRNPLTTPHIFYKIDPLLFIGFALILSGLVGFKFFGWLGLVGALAVTWLSSVIIGSTLHGKRR